MIENLSNFRLIFVCKLEDSQVSLEERLIQAASIFRRLWREGSGVGMEVNLSAKAGLPGGEGILLGAGGFHNTST